MRGTLTTIVVALLVGGGGTYLWLYYGGFQGEKGRAVAFVDTYGTYTDTAERVELLVHLPGTKGNTDRQELLSLLTSILTDQLTPERREQLARIAFSNLESLKKEVDEAQGAQAGLYATLQDLDNAARAFRSIGIRLHAGEVVELARKRAELSARITSALTQSNEYTYAIITRILSDKGELTQDHITDINNATASAEQRFAVLEGLYAELTVKKQEIDKSFKTFLDAAL